MTPRQVVVEFQGMVRELESYYDSMVGGIGTASKKATREGILAEQTALEVGIRWEAFINDLFVAYVLRSQGRFLRSNQEDVKKHVKGKFGETWSKLVYLRSPTRWTSQSVQTLLDPKGWHMTFTTADKLSKRANELLGSRAKRFSLEDDDRQLVDFVTKLRNYLAHRSPASRTALEGAANRFTKTGSNRELVGPVRSVRAYLRNPGASGRPRIKTMFERMSEIAGKLA